MKLFLLINIVVSFILLSCAKKDEHDSPSSASSSKPYYDPTTGAVIGSYTCAENESESEVLEIFQLGTTNCNEYCEKYDGWKLSPSECYSAWKNGETNLNYQFTAKSWTPLNTVHNSDKVYLYNFTPLDYSNISLSDSNGTFKSNISIKAWNRIKYSHSTSGDNISITIPVSDNPVMSKFENIKTKWSWAPHNYDPDQTHSNWWTNITGAALRAYYTLNYNMAYYLSSDNFSSIINTNTINLDNANVTWYNSSWGSYDNNSVIVTRMREIDAILRIGVVHGGVASGLGGGDVHGLAPHVLSDAMISSEWNNKIRNNFAAIWFHEFAHVMGFGHNSNMTYAQAAPYNADISTLVQNGLVDSYKANSDSTLIPPGNQQDGINCWNNLAGLDCDVSRNLLRKYKVWSHYDDIIKYEN